MTKDAIIDKIYEDGFFDGNEQQAMSKQVRKALIDLLNYCEDTEQRHWEEVDKPAKHIYVLIKKLRTWAIKH